jgi:Fuc2NAc and GlcNAc transferase
MALSGRAFIVALIFVVGLSATRFMQAMALRIGMMDRPSSRSSHLVPTPRGGGLAIVITFFMATSWLCISGQLDSRIVLVLFVGGGSVAVIGLMDDRISLGAGARLVVHLFAATCAIALIGIAPIEFLGKLTEAEVWILRLVGVLAITWAINLFNFMDGIDGIAGAEAVFIAAAGALLTFLSGANAGIATALMCLAAATSGFLFWNWPPAKIFLGDVGSGFLGFTLAVLGWAASNHGAFPIEVWVILAGIFVVDASLTLIRRLLRGDRWLEAHRTHAYQQLARRWGAHLPVTACISAVNLIWLLPWAWFAASHPRWAELALVGALAPILVVAYLCGSGRQGE